MSDSEDIEGYASSGVQRVEDKQLFVGSTVNGAFERVQNDHDPDVEPAIQLMEGWKNGNIQVGTGAPAADLGHTWDLYIDAPAGTGWVQATAIYIKRPS